MEWTIEEAESLEGRRCVFGDPFLLAGARPRPRPANITLSPLNRERDRALQLSQLERLRAECVLEPTPVVEVGDQAPARVGQQPAPCQSPR